MISSVSIRVYKKSDNELLWHKYFFANDFLSYDLFKCRVEDYISHLKLKDYFNVVVNYVLES